MWPTLGLVQPSYIEKETYTSRKYWTIMLEIMLYIPGQSC